MYNEIDLHHLNFDVAINIFKNRYNEALKRKDRREILVIHGYGANKLDAEGIIAKKLRNYLSKNKDKLTYRLDMNQGVTYVTAICRLEN